MKARLPEPRVEEETKAAPDLPIIGIVIGGQYTYCDSAMANPVTVYGMCQDLKSGNLQVHFVDAKDGHWVTDCNTFLGLENFGDVWGPKFTYVRPEGAPEAPPEKEEA